MPFGESAWWGHWEGPPLTHLSLQVIEKDLPCYL